MKTQKSNTITIEVLKPMFTDTDKPFLVGDWIKAEKVLKDLYQLKKDCRLGSNSNRKNMI